MSTKKERPPTTAQRRVLELVRDGRLAKSESASVHYRNGQAVSATFRTSYRDSKAGEVDFRCIVRCQARGWVAHHGRDPRLKLTDAGRVALGDA